MDRLDGKGYKLQIRSYQPHRKKERSKLKVKKISLRIVKQIEVLWTKFGAITTEKGERVLNKLIDLVVLDSSETSIEPMYGGEEINFGAAGDHSMQHADPSRPPPKHGWMQKIMRYAAVFILGGILAFLAACHKDPTPEPQPNPNQPTDTITPNDTITPVVHHYPDTVYVPFKFTLAGMPNTDTIKFYADQPDVKAIIMDLAPMDSLYEYGHATGWTCLAFHRGRDTIYARHDIAQDKVWGRGEIIAPDFFPDSITEGAGAHRSDSLDLAQLGFTWRKWQH